MCKALRRCRWPGSNESLVSCQEIRSAESAKPLRWQSIWRERHMSPKQMADFYSRRAMCIVWFADICEMTPSAASFSCNDGIKRDNRGLIREWQHTGVPCRRDDPSKIAMALPLKAKHAFEADDLESDQKLVKFPLVKKSEEDHAQQAELTSFEELMLPHLDAAHNLARWLLRNEQDAQDVVQEAYLRAFKFVGGF